MFVNLLLVFRVFAHNRNSPKTKLLSRYTFKCVCYKSKWYALIYLIFNTNTYAAVGERMMDLDTACTGFKTRLVRYTLYRGFLASNNFVVIFSLSKETEKAAADLETFESESDDDRGNVSAHRSSH